MTMLISHPPPRYLAMPKRPLWDVLRALTGKRPPPFVKGYTTKGLSDDEIMKLQDWCATNCIPFWGTGIGLLEAAEQMVREAVNNGNIPPEEASDGK